MTDTSLSYDALQNVSSPSIHAKKEERLEGFALISSGIWLKLGQPQTTSTFYDAKAFRLVTAVSADYHVIAFQPAIQLMALWSAQSLHEGLSTKLERVFIGYRRREWGKWLSELSLIYFFPAISDELPDELARLAAQIDWSDNPH